jgi:hypothetical protein
LPLGTIDQVTPFQDSIRDSVVDEELQSPTAVQADAAIHEIPSRDEANSRTFGDGTSDHVAPFHASISVS